MTGLAVKGKKIDVVAIKELKNFNGIVREFQ